MSFNLALIDFKQMFLNSPLVSVIVPMYNQELYVGETLKSILEQEYDNIEIIIVDDGSTDSSCSIVEQFSKADSRIRLIRQSNSGPSVARNNAISHSSGKYILPVDSDDIIAPSCILLMVCYMEQHPECRLVYSNVEYFGAAKGPKRLEDYSFETLLSINCMVCTAMYRRSDYDKTTGYNPNMRSGYEDWDFWLSLLDKDAVVHKIGKTLFYYRIKDLSRNVQAKENRQLLCRQIYHNHEDLYSPYTERIVELMRENRDLKRQVKRITDLKIYKFMKAVERAWHSLTKK